MQITLLIRTITNVDATGPFVILVRQNGRSVPVYVPITFRVEATNEPRPRDAPELAAVQYISVSLIFGRCLHADDVASAPRLAHRQGADLGTGDERRQILCLLFASPVSVNLVDAEV